MSYHKHHSPHTNEDQRAEELLKELQAARHEFKSRTRHLSQKIDDGLFEDRHHFAVAEDAMKQNTGRLIRQLTIAAEEIIGSEDEE
jgi:ribosome recycling factor